MSWIEPDVPPPDGVAVRALCPEDDAFLLELEDATLRRRMPLDLAGFDTETLQRITAWQYRSMMAAYAVDFPDADVYLVTCEGRRAGQVVLATLADEVQLVDMMLAPSEQDRGVGTWIVRSCVARARRLGLPARLYVEKGNRAILLYLREGFEIIDEVTTHWRMEHRASQT